MCNGRDAEEEKQQRHKRQTGRTNLANPVVEPTAGCCGYSSNFA